MDVNAISKEMDTLERRWFAAERAAIAAKRELEGRSANVWAPALCGLAGAVLGAGLSRALKKRKGDEALKRAAEARLQEAGRRKQETMRGIEALEDRLLLE